MKSAIRRAVIGAFSGMIIGVFALFMFDQSEPPVDWRLLIIAMLIGTIIGSVIATAAGRRSVSVFWLYFVLSMGVITIIPWWHQEKTHTYLPLGTAYVNSPNLGVLLFVFLPHLFISVFIAVVAAVVHRKWIAQRSMWISTLTANWKRRNR